MAQKRKRSEVISPEENLNQTTPIIDNDADKNINSQFDSIHAQQSDIIDKDKTKDALSRGKFTMNGKSITGQTALDRLYKAYSPSDINLRGMYDVAAKAIKDGYEAVYNPENNTIDVLDENGKSISSRYANGITASPNDSNFRKVMGATFSTANDRFKRSGEYMRYVNMDNDDSNKEPYSGPRLNWSRGYNWFDYKNNVFDKDSAENRAKFDIIKNNFQRIYDTGKIKDILNDAHLDISQWKGHESDLNQLRTYASRVGNGTDEDNPALQALYNRIKTQTLTSDDSTFLKLMGFNNSSNSSDSTGSTGSTNKDSESDWKGDISSLQGATIKRGDDGLLHVDGGIFNGYKNWYLGGLDAFKGTDYENGFVVNGILRTQKDVEENPNAYRSYIGGFIGNKNAANWKDWYNGANNSGVRFVGDRIWYGKQDDPNYYGDYSPYDMSTEYSPELYDYFHKNNINGVAQLDVTNWFQGVPSGKKVYSYLDPTIRNYAGVMKPQYVYLDDDGSYKHFDNTAQLAAAANYTVAPYFAAGDNMRTSNWEWQGNNKNRVELAVKRNFTNNGQNITLGSDRDGNTYIYWNNQNPVKVHPEQMELLKDYISGKRIATTRDLQRLANPPIKQGEAPTRQDTWNMVSEQKQGGKINWSKISKLQYGYSIPAPQAEEPRTFEKDGSKDVVKDHKINGTDGGLSKEERQQLIAAGLDLAGVGASMFGPVGNIVGGLTGMGGSIMRYIADKKQGNQGEPGVSSAGKDLALGLALDAASFIPFAGLAAKTAKAAKVVSSIRKFAKPLMTLATAVGATSMINPLSKVIKGEDLTSQDLVDLGRGLSSGLLFGAGAAKSIRKGIGQRKLLNEKLGDISEKVYTAKVGDKELKKTAAEINDMVTEANGSKKDLIAQIKAESKELGQEISDGDAKKVLDTFGVKFDQTVKKGWFKNRKVVDRKGHTTFENSNPEARSTLGYAWRDMMGGWGNNNIEKFIAGNVDKATLRAANKNFSTALFNHNGSTDIYLRDLMVRRPDLFAPTTFTGLNLNWKSGKNQFLSRTLSRTRSKPRSPAAPISSAPAGPISSAPAGPVRSLPTGPIKLSPPVGPVRLSPPAGPIRALLPDSYRYFQVNQNIRNDLMRDEPSKLFRLMQSTNPSGIIMPKILEPSKQQIKAEKAFEKFLKSIRGLKNAGKISKYQHGGGFLDGLKLNIPNILDTGSMLANIAAINKVYKDLQKANNALKAVKFDTPRLHNPRFSTAGIENTASLAEKPYLNIQFNSSDNAQNMAGELQRADKIANIEQQKGDQLTKHVTQFAAQDAERSDKQSSLDTQASNQKSQHIANTNMLGYKLDASRTQEQQIDNIIPLSYQFRQQERNAWNSKLQNDASLEESALNNEYNDRLDQLKHNTFDADYNKYYADNKDKEDVMDFDTWVIDPSNSKAYQKFTNDPIVRKLQEEYLKKNFTSKNKYLNRQTQFIALKQGGKTTQRRDVMETLAIQGDREAKRAVQIATQHLNRMFEKLMK